MYHTKNEDIHELGVCQVLDVNIWEVIISCVEKKYKLRYNNNNVAYNDVYSEVKQYQTLINF